jgi:hypothetical protein
MSRIFISYSHKDKTYAHKLHRHLLDHGFDAWIDDRIDYGTHWSDEIEKNLRECSAFILVMSPSSQKSDWVQNELAFARELKKSIFPLLLEGNVWWFLHTTQFVDVKDGKLPPTKFFINLAKTVSNYKEDAHKEGGTQGASSNSFDIGGNVSGSVIIAGSGNVVHLGGNNKAEQEAAEKEKARLEAEQIARQEAAKQEELKAAERKLAEKLAREEAEKASRDAAEKIKRDRALQWAARRQALKKSLDDFLFVLKSGFDKLKTGMGVYKFDAFARRKGVPNAKYILLIAFVILAVASVALAKIYGFSVNKGANIYVTYNAAEQRAIYQLVGGLPQNTNLEDGDESWSPVGDNRGNLYFVSNRENGRMEIFVLKSGGELAQVTDSNGDADNWSPAPDQLGNLYFVSNRNENKKAEIYVLLSSGVTMQVTDSKGNANNWSPVPDHLGNLYFVSNRNNKKAEIYVLLSNGDMKQVTNANGEADNWSPSPDHFGNLYFTSNREGNAEIFVLLSSGLTIQVTDSKGEADNWSPKPDSWGNLYFTSNRYGDPKVFTLSSSDGKVYPVLVVEDAKSWTGTLSERYVGKW